MSNCTLTGNSALYGGGLANTGAVFINNTTVYSNTAGSTGGGLEEDGGTLTLSNSTVFNNQAIGTITQTGGSGGGLVNYAGTIVLTNDTVAGNTGIKGGGIWDAAGSSISLTNVIDAGNVATVSGNAPDLGGTGGILSATYDLIGNTTGAPTISSTTDLLNTTAGLSSTLAQRRVHADVAAVARQPRHRHRGARRLRHHRSADPAAARHPISGAYQLQTITANTTTLAVTATSLTINGLDFDPTAANDSVTFGNAGVSGTVSAATSTSLTVSLTGYTGVTGGTALTASVGVDGVTSSSAVQVATAQPVVTSSSANLAKQRRQLYDRRLRLRHRHEQRHRCVQQCAERAVTGASGSSLTVSLTGLSSVPATTALMASATVDGISSGSAVQVATVTPTLNTTGAQRRPQQHDHHHQRRRLADGEQ